MVYQVLGIVCFGMFVMYDVNDIWWKKRYLHYFFFLGSALLIGVTGILIKNVWNFRLINGVEAVLLFGAVFFLGVLIYTLFFALPFKNTYQTLNENGKSAVCREGVYALCRHPGVLWFFFFYVLLGLALKSRELLTVGMCYSVYNLLYVIFQDFWTFPKMFVDYEDYKKSTPFLIPNLKSIKKCVSTCLRGRAKK